MVLAGAQCAFKTTSSSGNARTGSGLWEESSSSVFVLVIYHGFGIFLLADVHVHPAKTCPAFAGSLIVCPSPAIKVVGLPEGFTPPSMSYVMVRLVAPHTTGNVKSFVSATVSPGSLKTSG